MSSAQRWDDFMERATEPGRKAARHVAVALPFIQQTPEWHAARLKGVGSSDAPIIAGERGSVVELWAIKSGLVDPPIPDPALAELFEWGHRLEPVIADWYTDRTGRPIKRAKRLLQHPDIEWALASLDRETSAKGERRIVEIKTERWGWKGDEDVPGFVQAQVQHQLWVTGYDVADVAVLTGGSQPRIYEIPRDDTFIDNLRFLETEFMGWVKSGTRPPMDGSENARRVLGKLHPRNDGNLLPASLEVEAVALDWRAAKGVVEAAENQEATLANTIRALIGDADGFEGGFGRITWKKNADSDRVNWVAVAKAYRRFLEEAIRYDDPSEHGAFIEKLDAIQSIHTATVEGPRVLRPSWKEAP